MQETKARQKIRGRVCVNIKRGRSVKEVGGNETRGTQYERETSMNAQVPDDRQSRWGGCVDMIM